MGKLTGLINRKTFGGPKDGRPNVVTGTRPPGGDIRWPGGKKPRKVRPQSKGQGSVSMGSKKYRQGTTAYRKANGLTVFTEEQKEANRKRRADRYFSDPSPGGWN